MKLASRHVFLLFCDGALVLVLMRSHTHTSCAPFMHSSASPLTTLPLSPSVVGLLSQTSTFRPFFLATSTYFGFYFQCFPVFCLFVRKPRPQNFTLKNWKKNPPFLQKKNKKNVTSSQMTSSIRALMDQALGVLCYLCVKVCVACLYLKPFTT